MRRWTITNFQAAKAGIYRLVAANPQGFHLGRTSINPRNSTVGLDSSTVTPHPAVPNASRCVANSNYVIYASTDLVTWVPVATKSPIDRPLDIR